MTNNTTPQKSTTKIGNLTKDPIAGEGKGTNYARFSIAVETPKTPGDWKGERDTAYYDVTCFGSLATHVCETLLKGDRVVVTGTPELDTWTGQDGQERTTKRILVTNGGTVAADLLFASFAIIRTNRSDGRSEPRHAPRPQPVVVESSEEF